MQTPGSELLHYERGAGGPVLSRASLRQAAAQVVGLEIETPDQAAIALPHADVFHRPSLSLLVSVPVVGLDASAVEDAEHVASFGLSRGAAGAALEYQALGSFATHAEAAERNVSPVSLSASSSAAYAAGACGGEAAAAAAPRPCNMASFDRDLGKFVIGGGADGAAATKLFGRARGSDADMLARVADVLSRRGVSASAAAGDGALEVAFADGARATLRLGHPSDRALIEEIDAFTHSLPTVAGRGAWFGAGDSQNGAVVAHVALALSGLEEAASLTPSQRTLLGGIVSAQIFQAWSAVVQGPVLMQLLQTTRLAAGAAEQFAPAVAARSTDHRRQLLSASPAAAATSTSPTPTSTSPTPTSSVTTSTETETQTQTQTQTEQTDHCRTTT